MHLLEAFATILRKHEDQFSISYFLHLKNRSKKDSIYFMVQVIKATGEVEEFSEEKVRSSIKRAGISHELENQVAAHVISRLYENIPTSEIYHHIIEFLGTSSHPYTKARYSLKQAIMALGPTGYPFEDFFADILQTKGYKTQTRQTLLGKCITHEIDVVAQNDAPLEKIMVEAKFHNMPGTKTDVHVALYTKARFDDIKEKNGFNAGWLVTNTKISSDAINYCECSGIKIVSWNHPEQNGLRDLVEKLNLMPVTILTTLSQTQKQILLDCHVILCKDISASPEHLTILNLTEEKEKEVLEEVDFLVNRKMEEPEQETAAQQMTSGS